MANIIPKKLERSTIQIHVGPDSTIPEGWAKCNTQRIINGRTVPDLSERFVYASNNSSGFTFSNADNQPVTDANYTISSSTHTHKQSNNFNFDVGGGGHTHNGSVNGTAILYYANNIWARQYGKDYSFGNYDLSNNFAVYNNGTWNSSFGNAGQNVADGNHTHNVTSINAGRSANATHGHNIEGTKPSFTRPKYRYVCFIVWVGF